MKDFIFSLAFSLLSINSFCQDFPVNQSTIREFIFTIMTVDPQAGFTLLLG